MSGLRRIRRPPVPSRTPSLIIEDADWTAPSLQHAQTLPASTPTSRTASRSASFGYLVSGPSSPVLEDLHRFPAESLHSFSFSKQSEDYLHSRQSIVQKSVDFVRNSAAWASNPALAAAQARASGDAEIQGMMDLLQKAKILPTATDKKENNQGLGLGLGPMTGPADTDGRNIFESSFSQSLESVDENVAVLSPLPTSPDPHGARRGSDEIPRRPLERTASNEEISSTAPRRIGLKRTYTDLSAMSLQQKLIDALAQPYSSDDHQASQPKATHSTLGPTPTNAAVHSHSSKWSPAAQAVFRTGGEAPWTILAANDLACLIFGVTRAEVRALSILGLIQEDRRSWLEEKLGKPIPDAGSRGPQSAQATAAKSLLGAKTGITARLLSKAPSRTTKPAKRAATDDGSGGYYRQTAKNHPPTKSRGVLLCGDIVPIQKRNGSIGSASFWVMEKKGGLIWVIEEIREDVAVLSIGDNQIVTACTGEPEQIWGQPIPSGTPLRALLPQVPTETSFFDRRTPSGQPAACHFTAQTANSINIPTTVTRVPGKSELRVSSLPHMAGMMVLNPEDLNITSSNSVFCASLFGYEKPSGLSILSLIPSFSDILTILTMEDEVDLVDGLVVPEHSFRRAYALLSLRDGSENAANIFLRPSGLPAKHRDGSDIMVDVQMRVVRSESIFPATEQVITEQPEAEDRADLASNPDTVAVTELVYAVWITYSRQLHAAGAAATEDARPMTPPQQPQPPSHLPSPPPVSSDESVSLGASNASSQMSLLSPTVTNETLALQAEPLEHPPPHVVSAPHPRKTIADFKILEEMGAGAYGQVKLGRYKAPHSRKVVLKYVTKKRILVDTWTRDRRLGTVPLEVHVMDYLRKDGLRHPNIVEMIDFFEDDVNYYIEMLPHGIPGMDLFDYIELRSNMEEEECRSIFRQVVAAIWHLHVRAGVVHRDIKDENVVLDGEGRIKLIDFGSAAYLKNGPFDVFVGTIDYAAPEVLQGKPYGGKEQDVWALGILLYTIVYKENPFYNIDEILDHPLRVPYLPFSEGCIDLIRRMLDRDVDQRVDIEQVKNHHWLAQVGDDTE
ncbi:uncharacterized protein HMPREF1541_09451 [Cyphellophora europaea CBS 101466]|uniref:non-specific serine/threonine protein kinase n=1 Tax=Cyphellophora europaea (strain CBS 101466) TaxID=1220924 RepID=W2SCF9_CYPE1|nr:uncharacterized protein HMPREF1541_09451 [Cyphellophora europaea CBS 101466]ETN45619.1 hypothetical protein HMPREF1541_09451 [Cyphellophora europaea CBS 101466]